MACCLKECYRDFIPCTGMAAVDSASVAVTDKNLLFLKVFNCFFVVLTL